MKSLFVMDPLDRIVVQGDSTYATMRECSDRGWPVWMCVPDDLFSEDGRALARVTRWLAVGVPAMVVAVAVWNRRVPR